jgi:hypothetical protein
VVVVVVAVVVVVGVVVSLGGATVAVVVVDVESTVVGGGSTVVGVVVVEDSPGLASAIEPDSAMTATTAGATARSTYEGDTILTTSHRTAGYQAIRRDFHRQDLAEP